MSETTAQEAAGTDTQERSFGARLLSGLVRVREVSILIVLAGLVLYFQTANGAFLKTFSEGVNPLMSVVRFFETGSGCQLREALAPLVDDVTRLAVGAASGVGRWSGV